MDTPQQRVADALVALVGVGESTESFDSAELLSKLADHTSSVVGADACGVVLPPAPEQKPRTRPRNGKSATSSRPAGEPSRKPAGETAPQPAQRTAPAQDAARVISSHPGLRQLEEEAGRQADSPAHACLRSGQALPDVPLDGETARATWPRYAARAREAGFTRTAVLLLPGEHEPLGALVLLSTGDTALPPQALDLGRSLAEVTAHSLLRAAEIRRSHAHVAQLEHALTSRVTIEQAKGVLATRLAVPMDTAFNLLRGHARTHGRLLNEIAHEVIEGSLTIER
ncbi:ANTAR domain-containing protein [Streptomyces sp. NPDC051561]|uniref:ANTAR domain-containing protein n=1 Tax=Streptomyces sp. NPDC051561 TaxID=3365658 RepID=UPI0037898E9B